MVDLVETDPKTFIVRHIENGRVWNVSEPLATIEQCKSHIAFRDKNFAANVKSFGWDATNHGRDVICRIVYEEIENE